MPPLEKQTEDTVVQADCLCARGPEHKRGTGKARVREEHVCVGPEELLELLLPLPEQTVQGAFVSASGLLLLPMMIPVVIVSQIAGRVMTRTGKDKRFPIIGSTSMIVGGILLSTMTTSTPAAVTAFLMVFMGIGSGLTQQMTTTIAQNSVEQRDIGAASGVVTLLRTLGGSIAVTVFGTIYTAHTSHLAGAALTAGVAASTQVIFVIVTVAVAAAVALAAAFGVREIPLRGRAHAATPSTSVATAAAVTTPGGGSRQAAVEGAVDTDARRRG